LGDTSSYSLVQIEHEWFAPLLPDDRRNRWAIDLQNLISVRARQAATIAKKRRVRWLLENDAKNAVRLEQWISRSYDTTIAVSDFDAACLDRAVVVPNGVDLDRFKPDPIPSEPRLLFSGSFNYEPNVDAALWFCDEVFPSVRRRVPNATLAIVGRQPDHRIRNLAELAGVEAYFDVPSIGPYLGAARVVVVPVRVGSGTRVKALEAMAAGRPLVGTPVGLEGLGLEQGLSAEIAGDAEGLTAGIVRLLTDGAYAERLASAGRRLVEDRFSWDRIAEIYLECVLGPCT
jgi:glycosyltransferase involved in cell wall biosynthesis